MNKKIGVNLSSEGWLMCYPLKDFFTIAGLEKTILTLEKHGDFPSKTDMKNMLSKTIRLSNKGATVTNKHFLLGLKLIDSVYRLNGWER